MEGREPLDRNSFQKVSPSGLRFKRVPRLQSTGFPNQVMGTQESVRNCLACKHDFLTRGKQKLTRHVPQSVRRAEQVSKREKQ